MKPKHRRISPKWRALVGAAVTSLSVGTLSADPGSGTQFGSDANCVTIEETTYCQEIRWQLQDVATRSGNIFSVGKGSYRYLEIDQAGEVTYEYSYEYRTNLLEKEGARQQLSQWFSDETAAFGFLCTSSYTFHEVDGRVVLERSDQECVPDAA